MDKDRNIAEILSCPLTIEDAWTELYRDQNLHNLIVTLRANDSTVFRMIGPFVGAQRIFIPSIKSLETVEGFTDKDINIVNILKDINSPESKIQINKFRSVVERYIKDIESTSNASFDIVPSFDSLTSSNPSSVQNINLQNPVIRQIKSLVDLLKIMDGRKKWQDCLLVNVVVVNRNEIRVLPLFRSILGLLSEECLMNFSTRPQEVKINGLKAHDITIARKGMGPSDSNFKIKLSKKCDYLSDKNIRTILSEGLIDIPSLVNKLSNEIRGGKYYYRLKTSYKMPEELYKTMHEEYNIVSEKKHIDAILENISDIPLEAFENMQSLDSSIDGLEI